MFLIPRRAFPSPAARSSPIGAVLAPRRVVGVMRRRRRGGADDGAGAPANGRADCSAWSAADRNGHDAANCGAQACASGAALQGMGARVRIMMDDDGRLIARIRSVVAVVLGESCARYQSTRS